jgi:colanic acid biosynthesis protein WcaH
MATNSNSILLTGGAGYIGSHTCVALVSVDWVVTNPDGELLLGRCINASARGWWFTPGRRFRKNEALAHARQCRV